MLAKIRRHVGGLDESMATMKEIEPTMEAVKAALLEFYPLLEMNQVEVNLYWPFMDTRIGWTTTYLVKVDGFPMAYTDQMIK